MSFEKSTTNWEGSRIACEMSEGSIGEASTIVERWMVHRKRSLGAGFTPANIPYDVDAMRADGVNPVIPRIGTAYPTAPGATWEDACGLRNVSFSSAPRGMIATLQYSTRYFYATNAKGIAQTTESLASATTLPAGLYLPCKVLSTVRNRSVLAYRSNPGMTSASAALDASTSDIGGAALGGGRGQQIEVKQVVLKLRMTIDCEIGGQDVDAITGIIQQYGGKKNSAQFLGYGAGQLVCEGGSLNHLEHEFYELVMDYLYDEWYHHEQVPQTGADGRPLMAANAPSDVRFRRLARTGVDFNQIFPVSDLGRSYKYQAFKGTWM